jgi:hypothetical protein
VERSVRLPPANSIAFLVPGGMTGSEFRWFRISGLLKKPFMVFSTVLFRKRGLRIDPIFNAFPPSKMLVCLRTASRQPKTAVFNRLLVYYP